MKKLLYLLIPLLLGTLACRAQAQPMPDINAMVEKTLTAIALASPQVVEQPTATQQVTLPSLSLDMLRSGTYRSPDWGEFQLTDGVYFRPPLTDQESAETYTTRLLDNILYGDINSDGSKDAIVFLTTQNGGTGHFIEMAAVLNLAGTPSNVSTFYLGDRIGIESGAIQDGVITLNLRVQGPNDGLCCASQPVTWNFHLENDQLVQIP